MLRPGTVWPSNQTDCKTKQAAGVCTRLGKHSQGLAGFIEQAGRAIFPDSSGRRVALRSFRRADGISPDISLVIEEFDLFSREFLEGPLPPRERVFKPFLW